MTNNCNNQTVCENTYDENGNLVDGNGANGNASGGGCAPARGGAGSSTGADTCPTTSAGATCRPWQLTKTRDNCLIDSFIEEHIAIGGADINVFKMLGIHEQGRLVDLAENGEAISSGDIVGYAKEEAFTVFLTEWRSAQKGPEVSQSGFIGYDFGEIKLDNNRVRYSVDTGIKHNISTIRIKQGNDAKNRATKIRVERSADMDTWYGVALLTLPDNDCLNTIHFRNTVPMRYWRLRPIQFNGGAGDWWSVQALEMMDYDLTSIEDIQDKIWHENRDRDYASESVLIKGSYDLIDAQSDISRGGLELPSQMFYIAVSFSATVSILGRPIVIGDIFEMPSEIQYTAKLEPIKKYMEVVDVAWSTEGYTPGWVPTMQRVIVAPMLASEETADIVGGLEGYKDGNGFLESFDGEHGMDDGQHPIFQDYTDIEQAIEQIATDKNHLPERGRDIADVQQFSDEQVEAAEAQGARNLGKVGARPRQLYVEDGLPPNGLPFTEDDSFPANPADGAYHRLTYTGINSEIPARLFRWSTAKQRWIFMEKDKRSTLAETKPILQEFLRSSTSKPSDEIAK
jgi:hypothetical protein